MVSKDTADMAMFYVCFPCNPAPFAKALMEGVRLEGTLWIKTDSAKRVLWILMAQAYGQLAKIDLCDEWDRLRKNKEEDDE